MEISKRTFEDQALDVFRSDSGLFVVLEDTAQGTLDVLAKAASAMTGRALLELVATGLRTKPSLVVID